MIKNRQEIEPLIVLFLKGEASPEQAMAVSTWKNLSVENEHLFQEIEKVVGLTHNSKSFQSLEIAAAWDKVQHQLKEEGKVISIWRTQPFLRYAAAVLVIAALAIGGLWNNQDNKINKIADLPDETPEVLIPKESTILAANVLKSFTLQDQSKVQLDPGSELTIPADFNTNGRNLKLKGSGTFEVVHDEANPFIIEIENLKVIDVGTIFSLKTNLDTVKVLVVEGAVELRINDETLDVIAGDSAFYLISKQLLARYQQPKSRKKKVFKFDETPLSEVVTILGAFYERNIVVMDQEIVNCKVSVTFKDEELATILDIIKELLNVKVVQNKDIIGIYGKDCL
ncbi:MAG: FecR family protein, partial [Flavobacteriales bacterium]|nr:FecR family protein [Flavobacteriales bacterium]